MIYEKPKCDCGNELVLISYESRAVLTKIKKNGEEYSKPFKKEKPGTLEINNLYCLDCDIEYMYYEDREGRIIKGEKL